MDLPPFPPPRVAAIIPAYAQPGLLGEAISSVLKQSDTAGAVAVVVNDGCPFPETRETAHCFSRAYPGRVYVIDRANGGLSAARNTGIDFTLAAWPALEAVMFLDADNRIRSLYLSRALAALSAAPGEIGWVYPDIDMIGLPESWSMRGEFSFLGLLASNYCDAGSVIRSSLLRRGLRFDETMREGFEDWDFWLQAAEAGYRGQHLPMAGFQYRRRGESMVSQASRKREIIFSAMKKKRKRLLTPRRLQTLEAKEAPRFAIFHAGEDVVRFTHDPAVEGQTLTLATAAAQLCAFERAPGTTHVPPVLCSASRQTLLRLGNALVLHWSFWFIQVLLRSHSAVRIFLTPSIGLNVTLRLLDASADSLLLQDASMLALRMSEMPQRSALATEAWPLEFNARSDAVAGLEVGLPGPRVVDVGGINADNHMGLSEFATELLRQHSKTRSDWRRDGRPPRNDLIAIYETICGVGALLPTSRPTDSRGEVGFLIPLYAFGGVEKVVANQAQVLRRHGFRSHLFLSGASSFPLTDETVHAFASVNPLFCPDFDAGVKGYEYFGAAMSGFERAGGGDTARDRLGLLCTMDVVINAHSLGGHGIAGRLRELGVRTFSSLHLVERDIFDAPVGNPHMALAYEHAYEYILVVSRQLRNWCVAHGVPEAKVLVIPNAPSYPSLNDPEKLRALRATRSLDCLRVLFLGRLDAQKGLDRLAALIRATSREKFLWRVVGKRVLSGDDGAEIDLGLTPEPPLLDPAALDAAYDWADVLILPSRFEGAPLTALEARRRGVVVVATRVGAVDEIVADDGFLIEPVGGEDVIRSAFLNVLRRLADDRELLRRTARRALDRKEVSWEDSMAPLLRVLEAV